VAPHPVAYATLRCVRTPPPVSRSRVGPTDAALVVAARANEAWAKEALFRRHAGLVNGLAFRVMGRDDDLDDLVQDTFTEAWRYLGRLSDPQAFSSWISAIVVRTAHKMLRRRRVMRALGLRGADPVDLDAVISQGAPPDVQVELRRVYRLVESLPPTTRIAFVLRRIDAMPLEEIASTIGVSLATVKRRVASAEKLLLESAAGEGHPDGDGDGRAEADSTTCGFGSVASSPLRRIGKGGRS
jgi:RNA polymerase sigma-70 factor, ECF subfamily